MNVKHNLTQGNRYLEVSDNIVPFSELSPIQQNWVDYNVVQGVITESDGTSRKMTVTEFAEVHGISRKTCYDWIKSITNFWDLVDERRKIIFSGARTAKVWNALYLSATVKLNVRAQQTWLANADPKFRMPSQKVEVEAGKSWAELMAMYDTETQSEVIEGEVVSEQQS